MKTTSPSRSASPYWSCYTPAEQQALSALPLDDLTSEINLLRVETLLTLRNLQAAPLSMERTRQALHVIRLVASCQADLQLTQARGRAANPALKRALAEAYQLARESLGLLNPVSDPTLEDQETA